MTNLTFREFNSKTIRIRADRYVCLTDMAKATGKKVNDWLRLKSTVELIEAYSGSTGIPADQLIEVNESEGSNDNRGTFAHPHLSLDFAQWCNVQLKIQCLKWLDELLTTGKVELEPTPTPQTVGIDPNELNLLRLGLTSVNSALVDGLILNELGKLKPNLLPQIKEAQKLIAATNIIPFVLMTPKVLGQELGVSAIKVNRLLCQLGFQVKNENKTKGSPDYIPTEIGKEYAEMTMSTGSNGDNTTYQHLKWKEKIKDVLKRNLK